MFTFPRGRALTQPIGCHVTYRYNYPWIPIEHVVVGIRVTVGSLYFRIHVLASIEQILLRLLKIAQYALLLKFASALPITSVQNISPKYKRFIYHHISFAMI